MLIDPPAAKLPIGGSRVDRPCDCFCCASTPQSCPPSDTDLSASTSSLVSAPTWRLAPDAGLQLRFWGDECVLFHGASGDTHRLPEVVGQLLERLAALPMAAPQLSHDINLHEDDVAAALQELSRLGIVEVAR